MEPHILIELVNKAKLGDKQALEGLFIGTANNVYRLALRILKNPEDAEDITQEVFITIQQKISDLREPAAFKSWANQITANKCNRFFGKHKGFLYSDDENELATLADDDEQNMPDKALDDAASRKIIMSVIDNLPDKQRICILLFYYGQLSVADIATALETNENTVKTRLSMARAKIRVALEEKAAREGIKLWGIPLLLAPVIGAAMEQIVTPVEVQARVLETLAYPDPTGAAAGQAASGANVGSASSSTATASGGTALGAGIIAAICCVVAAAVITTTVLLWPRDNQTHNNDYARHSSANDTRLQNGGFLTDIPQQFSAGSAHSLAIRSDGSILAWGSNDNGRLGDGTTDVRISPVEIPGNFTAVSAGGIHSMAICAEGALWAWGSNAAGRLGDGSWDNTRSTPIRIMEDVIAISASQRINFGHSLAITSDGVLWAWGSNTNGRLGTGDGQSHRVPVRIMDNIIAVHAGYVHSLALDANGGLWSWGSNIAGRIGDGTIGGTQPTPVHIMDNITAISVGNNHSMAIDTQGGLWAWGSNFYGVVGCGTNTQRHPAPIHIMDDVIAISAGYRHSLAITSDGTLWAWGINANGRLGLGYSAGSRYRAPIQVMDGVIAISAGNRHSLAITTDGNLYAWGYNGDGRLGDGTTQNRYSPTRVLDMR